jgi:hypothetical protein
LKTLGLQQYREHFAEIRMIFDNQDGLHSGPLPLRGRGWLREDAVQLLRLHGFH